MMRGWDSTCRFARATVCGFDKCEHRQCNRHFHGPKTFCIPEEVLGELWVRCDQQEWNESYVDLQRWLLCRKELLGNSVSEDEFGEELFGFSMGSWLEFCSDGM